MSVDLNKGTNQQCTVYFWPKVSHKSNFNLNPKVSLFKIV